VLDKKASGARLAMTEKQESWIQSGWLFWRQAQGSNWRFLARTIYRLSKASNRM